MGVYERLGVKTIINARGAQTLLGGSIMDSRVLEAMTEAAPFFVDITELNRKAGEIIARVTGAQSGYISTGATDAILLATAGLMTGTDPAKVQQLPDTTGMNDQVIVHRSQRHWYDQAVRAAGATLVEIGSAWSTSPWELESAISSRTAGVFYTESPLHRRGFLPLADVIELAHARSIPVYVDAASMLPPASNLRKYVTMGADLVIFSGGKGIMGPQSTGILCGRQDLVQAAALNGSPHRSIGRGAKVSKEEMIGLITALELYVERDHAADQRRWRRQAEHIASAVSAVGLEGVETSVVYDEYRDQLPEARISLRENAAGMNARDLDEALYHGEPSIAMGISFSPFESVVVPHMLRDGEEEIVAERIVHILEDRTR